MTKLQSWLRKKVKYFDKISQLDEIIQFPFLKFSENFKRKKNSKVDYLKKISSSKYLVITQID